MIQCFENTILKWISILVFAFLVFLIVATVLAYQQGAFASASASHEYEFVYCHNEVTNTTITYPEGTECDGEPNNIDDDEDDDDD